MRVRLESSGRELTLGAPVGGGGEGHVFADPADPRQLIKIYKSTPAAEQVEKLRLLVARGIHEPPSLDGYRRFATPEDLAVDPATGAVKGFAMPRIIGAQPLHAYYTPKSPTYAPAPMRAEIAADLARSIAEVHAYAPLKLVVGDVNDANVLADHMGRVTWIDVDSWQATTPDGRVLRCRVGVDEYTPPRLHGVEFGTVDRSPEDDRFGLAVLVWQLRFAWHPFADTSGRTLASSIKAGRWPHAAGASASPPPDAAPLQDEPNVFRALCVRAFDEGHADPRRRPTGDEWARGIEQARRRSGTPSAAARVAAAWASAAESLRRIPPGVRAAALVVLLPIVGFLAGSRGRDGASPPPPPSPASAGVPARTPGPVAPPRRSSGRPAPALWAAPDLWAPRPARSAVHALRRGVSPRFWSDPVRPPARPGPESPPASSSRPPVSSAL